MTEADSRIAGANGHALQTDGNRNEEESLAEFGRAIGHRSRIAILQALMGGKALSATELAWHADVTAQTATSHLGELMNAGLLYRRKCGRFHYYELYNEEVASLIEQLASSVPVNGGRSARRRVKPELKKARFCYDHLAGELGVAISRRLVEMGALVLDRESYLLPEVRHPIYRELGVDLDEARSRKRRLCPRCLDWTERLPHVAGAVGAAIAGKMVEREYITRSRDDRSVAVTETGSTFLADRLGFSASFFASSRLAA